MKLDARFYFANLGADVARCIAAAEIDDETRYQDSLDRAYHTLTYLRTANRPEAYEEGMLLLRGLEKSRFAKTLPAFKKHTNSLISEYSMTL